MEYIASRIKPRKQMVFYFLWPQCLTHNDKCFGDVKLTIVSTPRIDYNYGDEMIRQNLNVTLTQEKPDGKLHNLISVHFIRMTTIMKVASSSGNLLKVV